MRDDLIAMVRTAVAQALRGVRLPQKGTVTSYDPRRHMAKVRLEPQGVETGWIQAPTFAAGNAFGLTFGLRPGDEVIVGFESGALNSGFVLASLYNGQIRPVPTKGGEAKLVHKSGSHLKFFDNGDVELRVAGNWRLVVDGNSLDSCAGTATTNRYVTQGYGPNTGIPGGPVFNAGVHDAGVGAD